MTRLESHFTRREDGSWHTSLTQAIDISVLSARSLFSSHCESASLQSATLHGEELLIKKRSHTDRHTHMRAVSPDSVLWERLQRILTKCLCERVCVWNKEPMSFQKGLSADNSQILLWSSSLSWIITLSLSVSLQDQDDKGMYSLPQWHLLVSICHFRFFTNHTDTTVALSHPQSLELTVIYCLSIRLLSSMGGFNNWNS